MKAIINGRAILVDKDGNFCLQENTHILFDKKINKIFRGEIGSELLNISEKDIIDAKNKYISPGFINIHAHGAMGKDTMDEDDDALKIFSRAEASMGVTSFLPTTMTYDMPRIHRALKRIGKSMKEKMQGAKIIGAHMEGPFVSKAKCGAQSKENIKSADFKDIEDFTDIIKIITIAPEVTTDEFINKARAHGIILSMGHSDATYEEAVESIKKGKTQHITHLYNAMSPFHHRKPGIVGAAFDTDVKIEIIADNLHSSPMAQRLAYKVKGRENIILITDSMRASCLGDGISELGGQKVIVKDGIALLENGTLAGSIATMNEVIAIFKENTDEKLEKIIETATKNPAKALNIYDKAGSLEKGKQADLTVFDERLYICLTTVMGDIVYSHF